MNFHGKKVALLGFGLENQALLPYLKRQGAKVTICDKSKNIHAPADTDLRLGPDYLKNLSDFDVIFRSPGIPFTFPEIQDAVSGGVVVTSQTKYFLHNSPANVIGITGTKGKSTTASLLYDILQTAHKKGEIAGQVFLAGNIGRPVIDLLEKASEGDWVVLELSSFQLQDADKSPHISVVLPISDDHLDYHVNREEYVNSKRNIVRFQTENDYLVTDDSTEFETSGKIVKIKVGEFRSSLLGNHNQINVAAAAAAARIVGASNESIKSALENFSGLAHRLQFVAEKDRISYYDDSKSTAPNSTIAAISSFDRPVILIAGGASKEADFSLLAEAINNTSVKKVICLGKEGERLAQLLPPTLVEIGGKNMNAIVKQAASYAEPGDVVLLSPGAASFDMFKNAEERGEKFAQAVRAL